MTHPTLLSMSLSIIFLLSAPLRFESTPYNQTTVYVGDQVTLECVASGNPAPGLIIWLRNNTEIPTNGNSSLTLSNIQPDDTAIYQCVTEINEYPFTSIAAYTYLLVHCEYMCMYMFMYMYVCIYIYNSIAQCITGLLLCCCYVLYFNYKEVIDQFITSQFPRHFSGFINSHDKSNINWQANTFLDMFAYTTIKFRKNMCMYSIKLFKGKT